MEAIKLYLSPDYTVISSIIGYFGLDRQTIFMRSIIMFLLIAMNNYMHVCIGLMNRARESTEGTIFLYKQRAIPLFE